MPVEKIRDDGVVDGGVVVSIGDSFVTRNTQVAEESKQVLEEPKPIFVPKEKKELEVKQDVRKSSDAK